MVVVTETQRHARQPLPAAPDESALHTIGGHALKRTISNNPAKRDAATHPSFSEQKKDGPLSLRPSEWRTSLEASEILRYRDPDIDKIYVGAGLTAQVAHPRRGVRGQAPAYDADSLSCAKP